MGEAALEVLSALIGPLSFQPAAFVLGCVGRRVWRGSTDTDQEGGLAQIVDADAALTRRGAGGFDGPGLIFEDATEGAQD
ncbi:hypothetical protein [Phenylobacterium sp.]|uniref:hypothetical protein n=1 Tax=Phenylobacterium sp. TaxID=1871053 RepID=UPI0025DF8612|nr:hypothetical protein [Phenylobacterium sp.]MCA6268421.1 hypothetical protein [Phenylobacterium sp.]